MNFNYSFPAVKGKQAGREYYITMVPLSLLSKLFPVEMDDVFPEYRAQRKINENRIPEMKQYILDNRNSYVFSALSASIDGNFKFTPLENSDAGVLQIDMNSTFLINDGQHRKAAIEAAIKDDESLADETISIVFFKDNGLKRSQQMFTDLNKHAVKSSNSLSTLYDSRDEIAVATLDVIEAIDFFKKYVDKEKDILGKNSQKLLTLNTLYKANQKILHSCECSKDDKKFLIDYWKIVVSNIREWSDVDSRRITKQDIREDYIICLSLTFNSFGRLGRYFYDNRNVSMDKSLRNLQDIDWSRRSKNWLNRTIKYDGKVLSSDEAMILTCSKIKQLIGLDLSKDDLQKEEQFRRK